MDKDPTSISDEDIDYLFTKIVLLEKQHTKMRGLPTCEYDKDTEQPYLLYPNGEREY